MCKKIILLLIFILFSCESAKKPPKGNFNDLVILSSLEDKMILENIIDNNIFLDTIFTPEPESVFNKIWIKSDQFTNTLLLSFNPEKTFHLCLNRYFIWYVPKYL